MSKCVYIMMYLKVFFPTFRRKTKEISKKQLIMIMPLTQGNCNPDSEVGFTSLYF